MCVAGNDNGVGGGDNVECELMDSSATWAAARLETYYVLVRGGNSTESGDFGLAIQETVSNDL